MSKKRRGSKRRAKARPSSAVVTPQSLPPPLLLPIPPHKRLNSYFSGLTEVMCLINERFVECHVVSVRTKSRGCTGKERIYVSPDSKHIDLIPFGIKSPWIISVEDFNYIACHLEYLPEWLNLRGLSNRDSRQLISRYRSLFSQSS